MRILYHHRASSKHGQAVHIEELVEAFRVLGHQVIVVGPGSYRQRQFGQSAEVVMGLKRYMPAAVYEVLELGYSIVALGRLWRAFRQFRPDVVYERANLFLLAGAWLKQLTGVPLLMEVNMPLVEERATGKGLALLWLARWAERTTWLRADTVLPVTHTLALYVREVGVPEDRIRVIPNGVDLGRFVRMAHDVREAKARLNLSDRMVVGFTGFVTPRHRLRSFLELMVDGPLADDGWHFLIVGDGPEVPALRKEARALGLEKRLTITGVVSREMVPAYVAAFDIAVQPGTGPYDSPLKLFEYMAMGKAIVAPDAPNIREVLTSDHDAVLFDPACPDSFKSTLLRLVDDASLRTRLGTSASQTIQAFTWTGHAAAVVDLAEQAAGNPMRPNRLCSDKDGTEPGAIRKRNPGGMS